MQSGLALGPASRDLAPMTTSWAYKATEAKVDKVGTMALADNGGFLCRSRHNAGKAAPLVERVAFGDIIHFYYRVQGKPIAGIGSYTVIEKSQHSNPEWFGDLIENTALYSVVDEAFVRRRDPDGAYMPDPELRRLTGWLLKKVGQPPACPKKLTAGQAFLMEYEGV